MKQTGQIRQAGLLKIHGKILVVQIQADQRTAAKGSGLESDQEQDTNG